ncbi:MAG: nicotinate (nicotinamide) nucleotide adenylyltransferase, partial [Ignavibacteriales bacterium]
MSSAGIFGGNFDPVHNGHLITAQSVLELRKLNKIIFIPAYISPFKTEIKTTSSDHRINMLKEAIGSIPYFEWSDIEINAGGISYTID